MVDRANTVLPGDDPNDALFGPSPTVVPRKAPAAVKKDVDVDALSTDSDYVGGIATQAASAQGFPPEVLRKMFDAISARVQPMDLSGLLKGDGTQVVPIMSGLVVTYALMTGEHERLINMRMSANIAKAKKAAPDSGADTTDHFREMLAYQLACSVRGLSGTPYTDPMKAAAGVDGPSLASGRLDLLEANAMGIMALPDPTFWLVWFNFVWFTVRARQQMSEAVLKNG